MFHVKINHFQWYRWERVICFGHGKLGKGHREVMEKSLKIIGEKVWTLYLYIYYILISCTISVYVCISYKHACNQKYVFFLYFVGAGECLLSVCLHSFASWDSVRRNSTKETWRRSTPCWVRKWKLHISGGHTTRYDNPLLVRSSLKFDLHHSSSSMCNINIDKYKDTIHEKQTTNI